MRGDGCRPVERASRPASRIPTASRLPRPASLLPLARLLAVVAVAALSGVMNAIAGGGTLLTFPALVALGLEPIVANASSTVALWPGSVGSMWGYREELGGARRWALGFAVPSVLGGLVGAVLLLRTPPSRFSHLVPWLVLGATALFVVQTPVMSAIRRRQSAAAAADPDGDARRTRQFPPRSILFYQFLVSIYGGYFGAGAGILMLAALGFMGLTNIHRMNGLKNWGGLCMNLVAAVIFAFSSLVSWPVAIAMAVGATAGGYAGSRMAQRVGQRAVRWAIIAIGLGSGVWLMTGRV